MIDRAIASAPSGATRVMFGDCGMSISQLQTFRARLVAKQAAAQGGIHTLAVSPNPFTKWTGGIIPYRFDPNQVSAGTITAAKMQQFRDGTGEWEAAANVNFVEFTGTPPANFITVQEEADLGGGESTAVGMQGGEQFLQFGPQAWNRGTVCHEMGHALGYVHEQQRGDRDTYVIIDFNNISSGSQANFTELPGTESTMYGPYDFYSVMEYSKNAFAIDPSQNTITMQPAYAQYQNIIGNVPDRTLSTLDRAGMATIYGNPSVLPSAVVTNTNDSGPGSLRSAIYYAFDQSNLSTPVPTTISFQIPKTDPNYNSSTGVFTITPTFELDAPGNGTTIDGTTETSFVGVTNTKGPAIVLNGSAFAQYEAIGAGYQPGFILRQANCTVKGFVIQGFDAAGIQITGTVATGNVVSGCYVGTDPTGTTGVPNAVAGIQIFGGAHGNTIGGTTTAARNIISGNTNQGVIIVDAGTNANVVEGNYIGLNPAGTSAVGNGLADTTNNYYYPGVGIFNGAQSNIIGGTATGTANVISGNAGGGVSISGTGSNANVVEGNLIGTNAAGSAAVANGNPGAGYLFPGVTIFGGSQSNIIGGTTTAARNIISGNGAGGVYISNEGSNLNVVEGNYIGTNLSGATAIANGTGVGIFNSASNNTIGGTTAATRNVIAGNTDSGIAVGYPDSGQTVGPANNIIEGNYVGLNATGGALGNGVSAGYAGIEFYGAAQSNTLGGLTAAARNVISGNGGQGVYISDVGTSSNLVEGNYIGTNLTGATAIANGSGLAIYSGATGNTIGGTAAGSQNIISGNTSQGVVLAFVPSGQTVGPSNNVVEGNYIGLNVSGAALGNGGPGVDIFSGAASNTIGGTTAAARNVISDNADRDVGLSGTGTNSNVIEGNYIGLDPTGVTAISGSSDGFEIFGGAQNNVIGGTAAGSRNYISGHSGTGISISGSGTTGTKVEGNTIGLNVNGTVVANGAQGIAIFGGADSNVIGGTATGAGNIISGNADEAIALYDNTDLDDTFSENSIYSNGSGIALYSQSNNSQAAPSLSSASGTTVAGTLSSTASTTFRIEFFSSPSGNEGQNFIGSTNVTTNSAGSASFAASLTAGLTSGNAITATATDPNGNTSQFSTPITATGGSSTPGPVTTQPGVANSDQATLSWTAVAGATSYTVGRSTVSGGPYTTVSNGSAVTSFTDTNLTDGTTYYYVIAAVNGSGTGPNSAQVVVTPTAQNLYWDTTTAAGLANGSGTWDTNTTAKWSNSSAGTSNPLLTWLSDDNAFFQTAGTLTATIGTGATVKAGSLTQAVAGTTLTVTGGTLQIDTNAGIVDAAGTNHSIIVNSALVLNSPNITIDSETSAGSVQLLGVISEIGGSRALTKIGPDVLTLGTVTNTFSGGVTLGAIGQVVFSGNASFGTGPITFNAGTSLTSTAQIYTASTSVTTLANNIVVTPGSYGAYTGTRPVVFSGGLTGSGTFYIDPTTSATSVTLSGDNHAYAGTLDYNDNGTTSLLLGATTAGSANAIWTLTGGSSKGLGASVTGASSFQLGEVSSAAGIGRLFNNQATGTATFQLGDATSNAPSFGGIIADGTAGGKVGVSKTGTDNQILSGVNTYTGPTVISGGTLTVNGSLAAGSTVTVNSGGTLAGTGTINGAANLASGGSIAPGGSGTAGKLTFAGGLNLSSGGSLNFDLATTTASDTLALTGAYVAPASGTVRINLNALSGFGTGTYPLITGASGISATSFTLGATPSGESYQLSASGGTLSVIVSSGSTVPGPVTTQPGVANSDQATLSWTAVAGATSYTVGRSTVSGGPYTTVSSGSAATSFTDTNLTDGTTYYYVIAAVNGSGTGPNSAQVVVTPTAQNLYWDTTTAAGLANGSGTWDTNTTAKWSNSSAGTSNPLLTWLSDDNAFFQTAGTLTATIGTGATVKAGSLTQAVAGTTLTVTGGTLQIDTNAGIVDAAGTNHSIIVNSALVLNSPNITIDSETSAGSVQLLGVISEIGGSRALTKIGPDVLTLGTVTNTFSGGVTLGAIGQVVFSGNASFGTGPITFNAGTSLTSTAQIYTASTSVTTLANNIVVTPGSYGAYTGTRPVVFSGGLTGSGTFYIDPTTSATSVTLSGDNHAYAGTLDYNDNGTTSLLLGATTAGSANAIWTLTGGSSKGLGASVTGASSFQLGEVSSAAGIGRLFNNQATGTATFQLGDATSNAPSFGGIIADGTAGGKVGVSKTGTDNQILSGVNTYTGPTVISGGTLTVNGSLAAGSTVTVNSGGTLAGTGTINGAANLASGGSIAPGGSGTAGKLTFAGGLNLSSGGSVNFDLATTTTSDTLALTGAYVAPASGTVRINLNALSGFGTGTYPLITGASGISATSFTLGATPSGESYQLSASGGTLSVIVSTGASAPAAPTGLAAVAANGEVNLAWSASTGATSYNVLRGTTSGGPYPTVIAGITSTSYSDTGLTNGTTYYYVVTATNASGTSGNSNQASATPNTTTVDSYWSDNDIGTVGQAGSASYSGGTFTLNGSGTGVSGTADSLDYTYQTLVGDGAIITEITTQSAGAGGVMMRESLSANARVVDMLLQAGSGAVFQDRVAPGGSAVNGASTAGLAVPYWVKLARAGNVFTGYTSPDGATWTQVGTVTDMMAASITVGLAQSSLTNASLASATFTNTSIVPSSAWASQDIGAVPIVGASYYSNGVATVQGTGASLYNGSDQFRYTYQLVNGDCDITARVASQSNSNTTAKAGVMIRASLTATSAHATVFVTPSSGVEFEWRLTTGGSAANTAATYGIKAPYWLRLVRAGNVFTAYRSPDGTTWTTIGSQTITMTAAVYIGLPVCSYSSTTPCTATFDNITVDP